MTRRDWYWLSAAPLFVAAAFAISLILAARP
jgi:hypothetical protein